MDNSGCDCRIEQWDPVYLDDLVKELELDDGTVRRLKRMAIHATADGRAFFVNRQAADDALKLARIEGGCP